ncbi:MAG: hypothetical protein MUC87_22480 [Bacteroidia bacterium]|jgi:hypothetical protein|nr:hypothetical protein [Bacteroidia bacterium]
MEIKKDSGLNRYYLFRLLNGMKLFILIIIAMLIVGKFSILSLYLILLIGIIGYVRVRRKVIYLLESISFKDGNVHIIYYHYGARKEIKDSAGNFKIRLVNASEGKTELFKLIIQHQTDQIDLYDLIVWKKDSYSAIESEWKILMSDASNRP